jgi:hypothetical protein
MVMCDCFLPTVPPAVGDWWRSDVDSEPGAEVKALAPHGENPNLLRWERVEGGWQQYGAMVNYYVEISPALPWPEVGQCWAGTIHPVVAVRESEGLWVAVRELVGRGQ